MKLDKTKFKEDKDLSQDDVAFLWMDKTSSDPRYIRTIKYNNKYYNDWDYYGRWHTGYELESSYDSFPSEELAKYHMKNKVGAVFIYQKDLPTDLRNSIYSV